MGRVLMTLLVATGCSGRVEKDTRPAFRIDASQPFRIEFGRGSGWNGLDTVKLDQRGHVILHRMREETRDGVVHMLWETATLELRPEGVAKALKAVESNDLTDLHRAYHDPDVHDGTQWILWIKQGEQEKAVYFDNSFPRPVIRFAAQLDTILDTAGLAEAVWRSVPENESRRHERELWDSIKR